MYLVEFPLVFVNKKLIDYHITDRDKSWRHYNKIIKIALKI